MVGDDGQRTRGVGQLGRRLAPEMVVAAAGVALSLLAFWQLRELDLRHVRGRFQTVSEQHAEAIRYGVDRKMFVMEALRSVFDASLQVDRGEFKAAARPHLDRQTGVQVLAWVPRASAADRVQLETQAREDGVEGFQIVVRNDQGEWVRAGPRSEYFPVCYVEPLAGHEPTLGWDLASIPTYAASLAQAGDTNRVVAARYRPPIDPTAVTSKFVAFMPVYRQGGLRGSVAERRRDLDGFVVGVFRIGDLVEESLDLLDSRGVTIQLLDVTDAGGPVSLYRHHPHAYATDDASPVGAHGPSDAECDWEGTLDVLGCRWLVRCTAAPGFVAAYSSSARWWALVGGLLFTAVLATWVLALAGRAARIQALVEQRTLALSKSQARLKEVARNANAATRAKSEFLANMSHEIRTPMTAILGFADLLLEHGDLENAPPERIEAARIIKRNGEHLLDIINDILDLSKVEAGKMTVECVACSPCKTVAEVASLVRVKTTEKGLSFELEYMGAVPETIRTDPTRLRQILINLIGNAIKFTETGGARLIVRFVDDEDRPAMQFDVVDTGLGMTEEQIAKLFCPFTQADASTTRKFGGTGLGLAISRRFAELLDGDLALVDSQKGLGTRFRLTVATGPLDGVRMIHDPMSSTLEETGDAATVNSDQPELQDFRILLAEDGPDNQRLISHILKNAGAEVTVRENGKLAVEAVLAARDEGKPFDVVLMDMQMPVMDGYEAAGLLRKEGYCGPIVALTANAMAGDREKCVRVGCNDYAAKPVNRKALIETIQELTGQTATSPTMG